jgi:hypothetical protein
MSHVITLFITKDSRVVIVYRIGRYSLQHESHLIFVRFSQIGDLRTGMCDRNDRICLLSFRIRMVRMEAHIRRIRMFHALSLFVRASGGHCVPDRPVLPLTRKPFDICPLLAKMRFIYA